MINSNSVSLDNGMDLESYINHNEQMLDILKSASEVVLSHGTISGTFNNDTSYKAMDFTRFSSSNYTNQIINMADNGEMTVKAPAMAMVLANLNIDNHATSGTNHVWIKLEYYENNQWKSWDGSVRKFTIENSAINSVIYMCTVTPTYPVEKYRLVMTADANMQLARRCDMVMLGVTYAQQ